MQDTPTVTESYTVHTPADGDREVWMAPARPGQMRRMAIVTFPLVADPASASVCLFRDDTHTGGRACIPLQAARFMARCHVEWPHPDDSGAIVAFASH